VPNPALVIQTLFNVILPVLVLCHNWEKNIYTFCSRALPKNLDISFKQHIMLFKKIKATSDKNLLFIRVASGLKKSGKFDIFSRSVTCQGILKIGQ